MRANGHPPLNQVRRIHVRVRITDLDRRFTRILQISESNKVLYTSKLQFIRKITGTIQPHVHPHVRAWTPFRRVIRRTFMTAPSPKRTKTPITIGIRACTAHPRIYPATEIQSQNPLTRKPNTMDTPTASITKKQNTSRPLRGSSQNTITVITRNSTERIQTATTKPTITTSPPKPYRPYYHPYRTWHYQSPRPHPYRNTHDGHETKPHPTTPSTTSYETHH